MRQAFAALILLAMGAVSVQAQQIFNPVDDDVSALVPSTRNVNTTAPLAGGGALSSDLTLTTSMATARLLGRITAGTGVAEELTGTQATTLLDTFTDLLKGLAPASGGGTSNFLRADGTWATPSAGSANAVEVTLDFGVDGSDTASTVVTGQGWVTGTSKIACAPTMKATASRAEGAEDAVIEGLIGAIHSRVAATGFTLTAGPRFGRAIGEYIFDCTGV